MSKMSDEELEQLLDKKEYGVNVVNSKKKCITNSIFTGAIRAGVKSINYVSLDWLSNTNCHLGKEQAFSYKSSLFTRKLTLPYGGECDLHHKSGVDAATELNYFFNALHRRGSGQFKALIITGKGYNSEGGKSILKSGFASLAKQLKPILACRTADPCAGGTGAFDIIWKNE